MTITEKRARAPKAPVKPKEKPARASIAPDARVQSCIPPIGGDYAGRIL